MYLRVGCLAVQQCLATGKPRSVSRGKFARPASLLHITVFGCALQVLLCDGRGQAGRQRQLTRFKDRAYSGCYRADGQLLVAGGESGLVQVGALHNTNTSCLTAPYLWSIACSHLFWLR